MSTEEISLQEQQRLRRQRINRMKSGIILTIALWMIFSLLAIIVLSVQVGRLHTKVRKLEKHMSEISSQQALAPEKEIESTNRDTESQELTQDSEEVVISAPVNYETGIDASWNLASEGDSHFVYLTFDCELSENTEALLDVLATNNMKATFFISGTDYEKGEELCQRMVAEGHTIGMHSYSNQYSTVYSSKESFLEDYDQIQSYIEQATGEKSKFYRFPGGSGNSISNVDMLDLATELENRNITYYDWNVACGDAVADYTIEDVVANVTQGITKYKTSVVLLHDGADKENTLLAMQPLIDELNSMGAIILPIDESTTPVQYLNLNPVE